MTSPFRFARDRGFSLPEVLITLALVSVLAAIAIPSVTNQRTKAVEAGMSADLLSASSELEAALSAWRGVPPAQVNVATSGTTWTATVQDGADVASGRVSSGTVMTGTIWADGSLCLAATSEFTSSTFRYRSDEKAVAKGSCPDAGFGGVGTVPDSTLANLPAAPGNVTATSPADNTVNVAWTAVPGATSYTVSVAGVASREVLTTSTQFADIQPGIVNVTVYAKNLNGTGPGVNAAVQVDGTTTYALSTRLNAYTYSVANQAGKAAIAGQSAGSTVWVADTGWVETWTGTQWVITSGTLPFGSVTRTSSATVSSGTDWTLVGTTSTTSMTYANGALTVSRAGRYQISFAGTLDGATAGADAYASVRVNGSVVSRAPFSATSSTDQLAVSGTRTLTLAAGDVVTLTVRQSSGSAMTVSATSTTPTYVEVVYLGPAA